jgi:hypothetical protein
MPKKSEVEEQVEEQVDDQVEETSSSEPKQLFVSPIAHPIAGKKLTKKVLKIIKKGEFKVIDFQNKNSNLFFFFSSISNYSLIFDIQEQRKRLLKEV